MCSAVTSVKRSWTLASGGDSAIALAGRVQPDITMECASLMWVEFHRHVMGARGRIIVSMESPRLEPGLPEGDVCARQHLPRVEHRRHAAGLSSNQLLQSVIAFETEGAWRHMHPRNVGFR